MTDNEQCSLPWVKLWRSKLYKCIPSTMTDSEFRQAIYAYSDYGYYGEMPQGLPPVVESVCLSLGEYLDNDRNTRRKQQKRIKDNSSRGKQKTEDGGMSVPPADGDALYNADEVKNHAERCGMPVSDAALEMARGLAGEYGLEQLLKAMDEAALKKPTWVYVRGILENWKNGSVPWSKHNNNPKNNYEQHDDSETDAAEHAFLDVLLREASSDNLDSNHQ